MVRILSWNVASLRTLPSKLKERTLKQFFEAHKADIVCFQETKFASLELVPKEYKVIDGYDSFWSFRGKGYCGVVTYARTGLTRAYTTTPFSANLESLLLGKTDVGPCAPYSVKSRNETIALIPPDELSHGRCVLTLHSSFVLLNLYTINGQRGEPYITYKMGFYDYLDQLTARLQQLGVRLIVTGDINTAHTTLDIYNPKKFQSSTGFLPMEREWISQYLAKNDMCDVYRHKHATQRGYTYWDQMRGLRKYNYGWRIDVFYISRALLDDQVDSTILDDITGSDHCPIFLSLPNTTLTNEYKTPAGAGNHIRNRDLSKWVQKRKRSPGDTSDEDAAT